MRRRHTPAEVNLLRRRLRESRPYRPELAFVSRKRHPMDCGNTRCFVCHSDKKYGHEETRQERAARLEMEESA